MGCALYAAHVRGILFIPQPDIERERPCRTEPAEA
jgi:hypothetical protein